jgi:hypothetical protein
MYWDPETDIIFLHREEWPFDNDIFFSETALLLCGHGWTEPTIHDVKKFAMEFDDFAEWVHGTAPSRKGPIFDEAKVVYVILDRSSIDGEADWDRQLATFMRWF